ncbi:MAG: IclR family transcriptional regulator [Lachnospiraceae bacterium]
MKIHRTVDRAISMLEIISNHPEGVSLNEISEMMEIPKSSCFDILHTLVSTQMIEPIGREGKIYRIGIRAFVIGNQYLSSKKLMEIAQTQIEHIGDRFEKSVFLAEDSFDKVVYVYKYQPKDIAVVASCTVGTKMEYYNTALGKCMLAFKDNFVELIDKAYEQGVISDKERLILEVIDIRKKKYVFSDQEHQKQLFCIASPIFDHRGTVVSALSMSGLYSTDERRDLERDVIHAAAEEISREIGYIGEY